VPGLDPARTCAGCGKPLSRYNDGDHCQACVSSTRSTNGSPARGTRAVQLPAWAHRLSELRRSRTWTPADLACELKKLRDGLPAVKSLTHMIQLDWETGRHQPGPRYRLLLAEVYGLDEYDIFSDRADSVTVPADQLRPERSDYVPARVLARPDFATACAAQDLGGIFSIACKWGGPGFTVSHVARRCEMSIGQVQDYIKRGRQAKSVGIFERVSDGLHIPGSMLRIGPRTWETEASESAVEAGVTDDEAPGEAPAELWAAFLAELDRLMQERNVGVRQLARWTNYDPAYISNIRNGRRPPSLKAVELIDKALEANGQLAASAPSRREIDRARIGKSARAVSHTPLSGSTSIESLEPGPDTIVINLHVGGMEVAVPISRRLLLRAGVSSFVEAFALDQQFDVVHDVIQRPRRAERLTITSPAHLQEILIHLREQWHALVKTDNLLGPRFALAGVLNQISVVEALRSILRDEQRIEVARLGAKYAESAAWLYEDTDNMTQARSWTSQAMEWAYEGNDERMLAWTIFRRAQQAAAIPDAAQTIGLAQAARRNEEKLATPTRAAIRVQEAYGHALDGNDQAAQQLLDEAHTWAASDTVGDAREGHGSYCTPGYIEIQRGHCWLAAGQPKKAISLYEDSLRALPTVYQRNRTATLTRLAVAYAADSQPEQAASTAHKALPIARSAGSKRIVGEIKKVGTELIPYRELPAVAVLLDELEAAD
jgi:transcriptional regulator with XRE-family HTH domain/tetratricopeptide (TPR) repeat protein